MAKSSVMNDWSEARVDPLAALLIQGGGQTGKYQAVVSRAIRGRARGQGRRQTERITRKQAGSERQAANDQERKSTVQVEHGKTN